MTVKLAWANRAVGASIKVYRSEATFDATTLPDVLESIAGDSTDYLDETVVPGTTYFYAVGVADGVRIALSSVVEIVASGGDGPAVLLSNVETSSIKTSVILLTKDLHVSSVKVAVILEEV